MKTKPAVKQYCQWHETMETPDECSMKPTIAPAAPSHTPTPWKINERPVEISGSFLEIEGSNRFPTSILIEKIHEDESSRSAVRNWKEDAAFIVRAVNAHEELLSLLKEARNRMIGSAPAIRSLSERTDKAIAQAEGRS